MRNINKIALATLLVGSISGQAAANLISNAGFEDGNTQNGSGWSVYQELDDNDPLTNDWAQVSGAGIEIQANAVGGISAHGGTYKVELDSHNGVGAGLTGVTTNTVFAQLIEGLVVNNSYELSFWYTARPGTGIGTNGITAYAGISPVLFSSPGALGTVSSATVGWAQYAFSFVATSTDMLVGFGAEGTANTLGGYIDDIALVSDGTSTATVSAPAGIALMTLGMIGLGFARKRKG